MKNPALAQWLEHIADFVAELHDPFSATLFEGVVQCVATGKTDVLSAIMLAAPQPESALNSVFLTKMVIWHRLEAELEPEPAADFQLTLELIFHTAMQFLVERSAATNGQSAPPDTDMLAMTRQLARANRELARLEKARTDFISIAAHELKTPLTVLQGYVDMLRENDPEILAQAAVGIVRGLDAGTQRMAAVVNDLLDVSALETDTLRLNFETASVESLVRMAVDQIRAEAASRQQKFRVEIAPHLPQINTDPARFHQVMRHLLTNAVKFTPDGGTITVSVAQLTPDTVTIRVRDTGIGISPEDREHVFDKFYRVGTERLHSTGAVKFKGAGTGLGLAIVQGIVQAFGGKIWVDSPGYDEVNCPGSTFTVQLPIRHL